MTDALTVDPRELIGRELVRIHEDSYGVGATGVEVFIHDSYVVCVIQNELTTAETTLIDGGRGESVRNVRMAFQDAIDTTFRAVVERATGRTVDAFISHFHLEPMFTLEFFRLAPRAPAP
ncbi:MAG TPA: Na-translocating system protein MpsC family protein [Thermoleophilaceae bacterium]|jgi:uncharacterized protein YbcI